MMATAQSVLERVITAGLRHPAVMAVKSRLRDRRWRVKGRTIANPPMPPAVQSILFVCVGNICRSPFAAGLAARRLKEAGLSGVGSASAGIRPSQAAHPPVEARDAATAYGVSLDAHVPQPLTRALMDSSDVVVVMEAGQLSYLQGVYPDRARHVVLLPLFDEVRSRSLRAPSHRRPVRRAGRRIPSLLRAHQSGARPLGCGKSLACRRVEARP